MISIGNILNSIKSFFMGTSSVKQIFYDGVRVWPAKDSGYLVFRATNSGVTTVTINRPSFETNIEVSYDSGATWNSSANAFQISTLSGAHAEAWVRGKWESTPTDTNYLYFTDSGDNARYRILGDIRALWSYDDLEAPMPRRACYRMFEDCTHLRSVTGLQMPTTSLSEYCYMRMFRGCTLLSTVPVLPATEMTSNCYRGMFYGCTSLTTGPELSSTSLADYCYREMFYGCTSLTAAPSLPALVLATSCYDRMFRGCTSLTTAPDLPAPVLVGTCYDSMFRDCSSLNYIKCLATDISATNCTANWVNGVAATGTFVAADGMTDWVVDSVNGIPIGWSGSPYVPVTGGYVTLLANSRSTVTLTHIASDQTSLSYSLNSGASWSSLMTTGTSVTIGSGKTMLIRGDRAGTIESWDWASDYTNLEILGDVKMSGNGNNLWSTSSGGTSVLPYCGCRMFRGSRGLTDISEFDLPNSGTAEGCYKFMFEECTNISKAMRILPATSLSEQCYLGMFNYCGSLVEAPHLPAKTLVTDCYKGMFWGCSNLNFIRCCASNISSNNNNYTENWVYGVAPSGTFMARQGADWSIGDHGIPTLWMRINDLGDNYTELFDGVTFTKSGGNTPRYDISALSAPSLTNFVADVIPLDGGGNSIFGNESTSDRDDLRFFVHSSGTYFDMGSGRTSFSSSTFNSINKHIKAYLIYGNGGMCLSVTNQDSGIEYGGSSGTPNRAGVRNTVIHIGGSDTFTLFSLKFWTAASGTNINPNGIPNYWLVPALDSNNRVVLVDRIHLVAYGEVNGVQPIVIGN